MLTAIPYYGPANQHAYEQVKLDEKSLASSNASPQNAARQVYLDPTWWAQHVREVEEDYKDLISQ